LIFLITYYNVDIRNILFWYEFDWHIFHKSSTKYICICIFKLRTTLCMKCIRQPLCTYGGGSNPGSSVLEANETTAMPFRQYSDRLICTFNKYATCGFKAIHFKVLIALTISRYSFFHFFFAEKFLLVFILIFVSSILSYRYLLAL
jgi:hypothetical protein